MANVDKRLYTKYWIRPELRVYHIDELKGGDCKSRYVEYLVKRTVKTTSRGPDNETKINKRVLVVGVKIHWFAKDIDGIEKQFHARVGLNEIVPADIVDKGQDELMRWSEMQSRR